MNNFLAGILLCCDVCARKHHIWIKFFIENVEASSALKIEGAAFFGGLLNFRSII